MSRMSSSRAHALNMEKDRVERENPERKVETAAEDSAVRKVIRDILSLPPSMKVPGSDEERRLLEQIICLMTFHNRKWLSEIQVAIPHVQLNSKAGPKDARLKAKVPILSAAKDEHEPRVASTDIDLRNYFLKLLTLCISGGERDNFPHMVSLFNSNIYFARTANQLNKVMESGAWLALSHCQSMVYKSEYKSRPKRSKAKKKHIRDYSFEEINMIQESNLHQLSKKIKDAEWRLSLQAAVPSEDSLFAKLLINAALNRFILENWAYERRTQAVAEIQYEFLSEMQKTTPEGLSQVVDQYKVNRRIRHADLAKRVLEISLSKRKNAITDNVQNILNEQANAVIASAYLEEYDTEKEVNRAFRKSPPIARAMIWLILAWTYLNGKKLPDDSPKLHTAKSSPVSRRARLTEIGQNMVTLRRMLSSLLLGHQHVMPSAERIIQHARYVTNVRSMLLVALKDNFKGATLSQWDSVFACNRSKEEIAEKLRECELPMRPDPNPVAELP